MLKNVKVSELSPPGGWCTANTIRIQPVSRKKAGVTSKIILAGIEKYGKLDAANLWLLMNHNTRLKRGLIYYVSKLMPFGKIKRIDTELVILRVAWNCRARYEWGQHVDLGLKAGLTTQDIYSIASDSYDDNWSPRQVAILKACDEFHKVKLITDETWNQLTSFYNQKLLLELLFLIGFYEGLAGVLNSVGLPLDDTMANKLSTL
ncbi:MAG: carboxymuconolactone decarboxylase family protein [Candidatus Thiodiazotropha sp. 6PLUC7]